MKTFVIIIITVLVAILLYLLVHLGNDSDRLDHLDDL